MRFARFVILAASLTIGQAEALATPADDSVLTPAERLNRLDRFRDNLSLSDRNRLDRALPRNASGGIARCDRTEESRASCEAAAYLPALRSSGLMPRFLAMTASLPANSSTCRPIPGVDAVLDKPGVRWIVAGEIHGTTEMPAAFTDLLCAAVAKQLKVIVALEHPVSEQAQIDEFLSSDGDASAREKLTSVPIWHWKTADGRTSEAYLSLIERLRSFKRAGKISGVVAFQPSAKPLSPAEYEREMSRIVEGASSSPDVLVIALVGNVHARTTEWSKADGEHYMPMAGLLPRQQTVTLDMSGGGGTAWTCRRPAGTDPSPDEACGPHAIGNPHRIYPRGVKVIDDPSAPYFAYYNIGTAFSSSSPAVR